MDTFGNRLKKLRDLTNKQQKEIAIELNIPKATLSSYENDLRLPGVQNLIILANYYNVSIDYLLCRDSHTNSEKIISDLEKLKKYITSIQNSIKK